MDFDIPVLNKLSEDITKLKIQLPIEMKLFGKLYKYVHKKREINERKYYVKLSNLIKFDKYFNQYEIDKFDDKYHHEFPELPTHIFKCEYGCGYFNIRFSDDGSIATKSLFNIRYYHHHNYYDNEYGWLKSDIIRWKLIKFLFLTSSEFQKQIMGNAKFHAYDNLFSKIENNHGIDENKLILYNEKSMLVEEMSSRLERLEKKFRSIKKKIEREYYTSISEMLVNKGDFFIINGNYSDELSDFRPEFKDRVPYQIYVSDIVDGNCTLRRRQRRVYYANEGKSRKVVMPLWKLYKLLSKGSPSFNREIKLIKLID